MKKAIVLLIALSLVCSIGFAKDKEIKLKDGHTDIVTITDADTPGASYDYTKKQLDLKIFRLINQKTEAFQRLAQIDAEIDRYTAAKDLIIEE